MDIYSILNQAQRLCVEDNVVKSIFDRSSDKTLVLIWSQLGDFDNLEYAWWLKREIAKINQQNITVKAIGIGDRNSGLKFCEYTGFPTANLYVDPIAEIHRQLELYPGLTLKFPGLATKVNALINLMIMCAGIGSPGTLAEVFRGYIGDRSAPQLIPNDETIQNTPLPPVKGSLFKLAGGEGFQRPFELATFSSKT